MRDEDEIESDDGTPENEVGHAVKVSNMIRLLLVTFHL